MHFLVVGKYSQYGSWGLREHLDDVTGYPKYDAMQFVLNATG